MTTAPSTRPSGTSDGSDALRALYADWSDIIATTPDLTMRLFRSIFDEWHQPTARAGGRHLPRGDRRRRPRDLGAAGRCEHLGGAALPHGGGFAVGSAASHRKLAAHVAKALGVTALRPGLPPRPRAPAPGAGGGRRRGVHRGDRARHRARGHHDDRRLGGRQPRRRRRARAARARAGRYPAE